MQSRFLDFSLRDTVVKMKVPGDLVNGSQRSQSPSLVHFIYLFLIEKLPGLLLQAVHHSLVTQTALYLPNRPAVLLEARHRWNTWTE